MRQKYVSLLCVADAMSAPGVRAAIGAAAPDAAVGEVRVNDVPGATPHEELARLLRQLHAGAATRHWHHALNNTLAALLTEAQLLAREPMAPDHQAAVERMIGLCRRIMTLLDPP